MRDIGTIPLAVESPAGRAELLVDGTLTVAALLAPLAAATGVVDPSAAGWLVWEGQRRLDPARSLIEQGVVAGSALWLTRG